MTPSSRAGLLILAQVVPILLWAADDNRAMIGYSSEGVLRIATGSGHTLRTLKTKPPIGDFAISANAGDVVFSPYGIGMQLHSNQRR